MFTLERFELADRVKGQARGILAEAEKIIRELEAEGILKPGITLGKIVMALLILMFLERREPAAAAPDKAAS